MSKPKKTEAGKDATNDQNLNQENLNQESTTTAADEQSNNEGTTDDAQKGTQGTGEDANAFQPEGTTAAADLPKNETSSAADQDAQKKENTDAEVNQAGTPNPEKLASEEEIEDHRRAGGSLEAEAGREEATREGVLETRDEERHEQLKDELNSGQDANSNSSIPRSSEHSAGGPNGDGQMGAQKVEQQQVDKTGKGNLHNSREGWSK